jgi:hypothetical protein
LQWTKALKIAIAEEDEKSIEKLIENLPSFENLDQMHEAAYLMKEAHSFLSTQKDIAAINLLKIKKQKEFVLATSKKNSSFDHSL